MQSEDGCQSAASELCRRLDEGIEGVVQTLGRNLFNEAAIKFNAQTSSRMRSSI